MARHGWRTIALGALALGAFLPATAQAAIGGGGAVFAERPNLQSVTFNGGIASFNFDRAVQPGTTFAPGAFLVGGYRAAAVTPAGTTANVSVSDPRSVLVSFRALPDDPDLTTLTFGAVEADAVRGAGTHAQPNLADAVSITGAGGGSGTRGHTTGPDLQTVAFDADDNRLTYVFDQGVSATLSPPDPTGFRFADAAGVVHAGTVLTSVDGAAVTIEFAASVQTARKAIVLGGSARATGTLDVNAAPVSVDIPGRAAVVLGPTLLRADLEGNSGTMVYTFDRTIGTVDAARFSVQTSNGVLVQGERAVILPSDPHQVRVTLGTSQFTEHIVGASVAAGAATSSAGDPAVAGGRPVGANGGSRATGYTSAPDAIGATINRAAGQVTVTFDSRLVAGSVDPTRFAVLSSEGVVVGGPPALATVETSSRPGPSAVVLQFTPEQMDVAHAVLVGGHRVVGGAWEIASGSAVTGTVPGAVADAQSVQTIISPTPTTAVYRKGA